MTTPTDRVEEIMELVYSTTEDGDYAGVRDALEKLVVERDQAAEELKLEESVHSDTIKHRDYLEGAIQGFHLTLGGDGEWSSDCDLVPECADMIEELQRDRGRLQLENDQANTIASDALNEIRRLVEENQRLQLENEGLRESERELIAHLMANMCDGNFVYVERVRKAARLFIEGRVARLAGGSQ